MTVPSFPAPSGPFADAADALARYLAVQPQERASLASLCAQIGEEATLLERSNMRGHLTTSAVVLDPARTSVLMIHHRLFDVWLQPGGHYEPPGTLWDSACREVAEETGVTRIRPYPAQDGAPHLLDIDSHPIPARPSKGEGPHVHHDFAWLAIADVRSTPTPQVDEVHDARWMPLDELAVLPNARMRRLAEKTRRVLAACGRRASADR